VERSEEQKMNYYIVTWNPQKWNWDNIEEDIEQINFDGRCSVRWSCGNTKSIQPGDRIFLVRLGEEPKGIFGSGFSTSVPFYAKHWSGDDKEILYINIDFESLLNPKEDEILSLDILNTGNLQRQTWTPQASGISIKPELRDELEAIWFDFLVTKIKRNNPFVTPTSRIETALYEGTPTQVHVTKYERNPYARKVCLEHYGYSCSVCNFNFEKSYGEIGKNYIHVHHLNQISEIGKTYEINPIKDLRPICPNCHSMIHRTKNIISIDELKKIFQK